MSAAAGDTITFTWSYTHDVVTIDDESDYDACTDSAMTSPGSGYDSSPYTYTLGSSLSVGDKVYFTCSVGSHCNNNQKLTVTVRPDSHHHDHDYQRHRHQHTTSNG